MSHVANSGILYIEQRIRALIWWNGGEMEHVRDVIVDVSIELVQIDGRRDVDIFDEGTVVVVDGLYQRFDSRLVVILPGFSQNLLGALLKRRVQSQ